ncbi:hypothetical protein GIB67_029910 [Kingdonia uniflora]|uniref:Uncharacterized protein n=1 Tax=Kingdonia uniflora TaxID=39325 RepID=A0A7J7N3V3_9MAGN|nr:hypothetical protein GIB67_029910 [Kingdonia uniflora]
MFGAGHLLGLGEYGTADGKFSASYITGKLCDVAEAHSNDDTVSDSNHESMCIEIAAGRRIELLPECQSLIDELSASHSTDLQQRAYELQAMLGLDSRALLDNVFLYSLQVNKSMSFLNGYVEKSLENGARPYIPENERSRMLNISSFQSPDQHVPSAHALRFEAYELPKPSVSVRNASVSFASSTDLVPVSEPMYEKEILHLASMSSMSDTRSAELKLRLEGVQKKWGRPTYSTPAPSTSNTNTQKTANGGSQHDGQGTLSSQAHETRDVPHNSRKSQIGVSPEKQKLAASLFGGSASKAEKKASSSTHKTSRVPAVEKPQVATAPQNESLNHPPPDLLDLGEPTISATATTTTSSSMDPFMQLEGLMEQNTGPVSVSKQPDLMALYGDTITTGLSGDTLTSGLSDYFANITQSSMGAPEAAHTTQPSSSKKGPNRHDSLEKDALARQMGVTPSGKNPNLFSDLLG